MYPMMMMMMMMSVTPSINVSQGSNKALAKVIPLLHSSLIVLSNFFQMWKCSNCLMCRVQTNCSCSQTLVLCAALSETCCVHCQLQLWVHKLCSDIHHLTAQRHHPAALKHRSAHHQIRYRSRDISTAVSSSAEDTSMHTQPALTHHNWICSLLKWRHL